MCMGTQQATIRRTDMAPAGTTVEFEGRWLAVEAVYVADKGAIFAPLTTGGLMTIWEPGANYFFDCVDDTDETLLLSDKQIDLEVDDEGS